MNQGVTLDRHASASTSRSMHGRADSMRWYRVLQALVLVTVVFSGIRFIVLGYYPVADDAYTAMSAWDLFTGHWPIQGPHSTSEQNSGVEVHHPGPLQYYLLAPFIAVLGSSGWAVVIGQSVLSAGCGLGAVAVARKVGGNPAATATVAAWVAIGAVTGNGLFSRSFPPYPSVVVLPLLLLTSWALLLERFEFLPVWVFAGALSVQPHLGNVPLALSLAVVLVTVGLVRWRLRRAVMWPRRGWRPKRRRSMARDVRRALAVGVLVWAPCVIELFVMRPNNLVQFGRYLSATPKTPPVGVMEAVPLVFELSCGFGAGHDRAQALYYRHSTPGLSIAMGVGLVVWLALPLLAWFGRRWDARGARRLLIWVALVDMALAVYAVGISRLDHAGFIEWEYVQVPAAWMLAWATLGYELWWIGRLAIEHSAVRLPELRRAPNASLVGAVAVLLALTATFSAPPRLEDRAFDAGKAVQKALPLIEQRVTELGGRKDHVQLNGDQIGSAYVVGWSLGYGMLRSGFPIHIATFGTRAEYWDYRKYTTTPANAVRVYIVQSEKQPDGFVPRTETPLTVLHISGVPYRVYVFKPSDQGRG